MEPGRSISLSRQSRLNRPLLDRSHWQGVADVGLPLEGRPDCLGPAIKVSRYCWQPTDHRMGLFRQRPSREKAADSEAPSLSAAYHAISERRPIARLPLRGG